ncbi:MAG: type IV toxin-antitoxin system AbiEi family antitoxin [Candidatus Bathyarchaeia archaeon]
MSGIKNIFAPKSSRILRVLLVNFGRDWDERELAEEAIVSNGLAHYVCKTLVELGFAARNARNRIVLVDPLRLLKRWASNHLYDRMNRFLDYFTFEREVDRFVERFAGLDFRYAFCGLAGAWLVAPYVRPVDVHLYVPSESAAEEIAERFELNPTPRGGNVKFVLPYDEGVFYGLKKVRGVKVVSNVQLFVDLYNFPARGEEASSQVLELMLKEWKLKREAKKIV